MSKPGKRKKVRNESQLEELVYEMIEEVWGDYTSVRRSILRKPYPTGRKRLVEIGSDKVSTEERKQVQQMQRSTIKTIQDLYKAIAYSRSVQGEKEEKAKGEKVDLKALLGGKAQSTGAQGEPVRRARGQVQRKRALSWEPQKRSEGSEG